LRKIPNNSRRSKKTKAGIRAQGKEERQIMSEQELKSGAKKQLSEKMTATFEEIGKEKSSIFGRGPTAPFGPVTLSGGIPFGADLAPMSPAEQAKVIERSRPADPFTPTLRDSGTGKLLKVNDDEITEQKVEPAVKPLVTSVAAYGNNGEGSSSIMQTKPVVDSVDRTELSLGQEAVAVAKQWVNEAHEAEAQTRADYELNLGSEYENPSALFTRLAALEDAINEAVRNVHFAEGHLDAMTRQLNAVTNEYNAQVSAKMRDAIQPLIVQLQNKQGELQTWFKAKVIDSFQRTGISFPGPDVYVEYVATFDKLKEDAGNLKNLATFYKTGLIVSIPRDEDRKNPENIVNLAKYDDIHAVMPPQYWIDGKFGGAR
jgi:hypothetical protein